MGGLGRHRYRAPSARSIEALASATRRCSPRRHPTWIPHRSCSQCSPHWESISAAGHSPARVTPALTLLPAFGLKALPAQTRAALGLALAASIAPSVQPLQLAAPFGVALLLEAARGLPIALAASGALWAAGMAGGLTDNLRGGRETQALPIVDEETSPLGALLSLLVALIFLETGGAARVAHALSSPATVSYGAAWQVALG